MDKQEILSKCTVEDNIVKLPAGQLDRKMYLEVSKALQLIGGKWKGGKVAGFVFPNDPTEHLTQISTGEKRNLKKEYQFFETPMEMADKLVDMAEIKPEHTVLEPSAGQGAIIKAVNREFPNIVVDCYELMDVNCTFLNKIPEANFLGTDFLEHREQRYDRIIANPPFAKNQDIDHIRKMYDCLKSNGVLVSIASKHWTFSNNKKEVAFAKWLQELGAEITETEPGDFKKSGTMITAVIIKISK